MNITFIGGGNMADALIGGLLAKGFSYQHIRVVEINPETRNKLMHKYDVSCSGEIPALGSSRKDDVILFAVKPQHMQEAARELKLASDQNLVISIAAGIRLTTLSKWLGGQRRLIRAMPNTPALIGAGITGLYSLKSGLAEDINKQDREQAENILGAIGTTVWVEEELHLDLVTALSGSGPAYVFYLMEAMEAAAAKLGDIDTETVHKLVLHTFMGAAKLVESSSEPLEILRERVTSKRGTTEAALESLKKDNMSEALFRAIQAALQRSRELGEEWDK